MHIDEEQLKDFAFDSGLVSKAELVSAQKNAKKQGLPFAEVLVREGFINEDDLRRIYSHISGIPFVDLSKKELRLNILEIIPETISRKHNVVSFESHTNGVEVAMLSMADLSALDYLKKEKGIKFLPRFTDSQSIKQALIAYQKLLKKEFGEKIEKESRSIPSEYSTLGDGESPSAKLRDIAEDENVSKLLNLVLQHAVYQGASDIHIDPQEEKTLVRFRIGGSLCEAFSLPSRAHFPIVLRLKKLAGLELQAGEYPIEGRFRVSTEEVVKEAVSFRFSIIKTSAGEKINIRVLNSGALGFSLETLGFHGEALEKFHRVLRDGEGAVVMSGPPSSGKTTTLYTALDLINKPSLSIVTIEDPIEYQMNMVNQTEVSQDGKLNMKNGLRTLIKQDPDVIMVGDVKEKEVATTALNASLSGKLVMFPFVGKNSGEAVEGLIKMGVEKFLIASSLKIVVGHDLVKKLKNKHEENVLSEKEIHKLRRFIDMDKVLNLLKEEGVISKKDDWTNIKMYTENSIREDQEEFLGIHEVLKISPAIKDLIIEGAMGGEIESQAVKEGMITMTEDALFKAASGLITIDEVFRMVESS